MLPWAFPYSLAELSTWLTCICFHSNLFAAAREPKVGWKNECISKSILESKAEESKAHGTFGLFIWRKSMLKWTIGPFALCCIFWNWLLLYLNLAIISSYWAKEQKRVLKRKSSVHCSLAFSFSFCSSRVPCLGRYCKLWWSLRYGHLAWIMPKVDVRASSNKDIMNWSWFYRWIQH